MLPHPRRTGQTSGWIWGAGAVTEDDSPTVAWVEEVHPADLRLMAAAPLLLAALQHAVAALDQFDWDAESEAARVQGEAAISKATTGDAP